MKFFLFILFLFFITISYLIPIHFKPWTTFLSEISVFFGVLFLILSQYKEKIIVLKVFFPLFIFSFLPLIQFLMGNVFYLSRALLGFLYLISFIFVFIITFNMCKDNNKREIYFLYFSYFIVFIGGLNFIILIIQWFDFSVSNLVVAEFSGSRPYGNLAQPNNLAILQVISLLSLIYLYFKGKISSILFSLFNLLLLFTIVLTQSRAGGVALLMSLITLFILCFRLKINFSKFLLFNLFAYIFISLNLNKFSIFVKNNFGFLKGETLSSIDRELDSNGRIDIWIQMYYAIIKEPLFGYGWNQVSLAQSNVILDYPLKMWVNSSHNIVLDIILWFGLPIGLIIILYFIFLIFKIFIALNCTEGFFSFSMFIVILVHSMLEYPLYYSYFLITTAFIFGVCASSLNHTKIFSIRYSYLILYSIILLIGLILVWKDYLLYIEENQKAIDHSLLNSPSQFMQTRPLYILDEFDFRIYWISLDVRKKLTSNEINEIQKMVLLYPTKFDLMKFAKILAHNGYVEEANFQLKKYNLMYGTNYTVDILFR